MVKVRVFFRDWDLHSALTMAAVAIKKDGPEQNSPNTARLVLRTEKQGRGKRTLKRLYSRIVIPNGWACWTRLDDLSRSHSMQIFEGQRRLIFHACLDDNASNQTLMGVDDLCDLQEQHIARFFARIETVRVGYAWGLLGPRHRFLEMQHRRAVLGS